MITKDQKDWNQGKTRGPWAALLNETAIAYL